MEKMSKEFLALVEAFCVFVVQQGEAITQNQEMAKLMNHIVEALGDISNASSGGSTKATIKVRLPNSFVWKETKTKWVWSWLHELEAHLETQCFKIDKEWIHFAQTLLKEHTWDGGCPKSRRHPTYFKPSHGKSSSCNWMEGSCCTNWGWDGVFGIHPRGQQGLVGHLHLGLQSHVNCGPPQI